MLATTGVGAVSPLTLGSYRLQVVWQGPMAAPGWSTEILSFLPDRALAGSSVRTSREGALIEPLTPREKDVFRLLAKGAANREIAAELSISLRTVETHLAHIYGKLGARGRMEAILCAVGIAEGARN
jgi:DNA-binding NarL/FixJ family response regulator